MDALKVRHKMISHFAAISPQVDINALVMDSTVKAPEVTCCFNAINITSYVYAHYDFNEAAFMVRSIFLCKYSVKLMRCCVSFLLPGSHPVCRLYSPGAADHS